LANGKATHHEAAVRRPAISRIAGVNHIVAIAFSLLEKMFCQLNRVIQEVCN
jgi:hypothetical protein